MTLSLEFIAGLMTGEGSFCLGVQRRKNDVLRITPIVDLFMSDRETITLLAASLQEHGLAVYVQDREKAAKNHSGVHVSGFKRVRPYCETFIPLLTGLKRQAAELVYEFILDREASQAAQGRTVQYSDKQKEIVRQLRLVNGNINGRKNPL